MTLVHGTCVSHEGRGVLLRGPSGSGKSDLALRLIASGFRLIADDQVHIVDGVASCPKRIEGFIEVRGLGVYSLAYDATAPLCLVVENGQGERVASPQTCSATHLPLIRLCFLHASCVSIVRLALDCLSGSVREVAGPLARIRLSTR